MIGYAGGSRVNILGKRLFLKRLNVSEKGISNAVTLEKPIEEWGDEITDELVNYEEESMANELDCAYRRIEKQKETLEFRFENSS